MPATAPAVCTCRSSWTVGQGAAPITHALLTSFPRCSCPLCVGLRWCADVNRKLCGVKAELYYTQKKVQDMEDNSQRVAELQGKPWTG